MLPVIINRRTPHRLYSSMQCDFNPTDFKSCHVNKLCSGLSLSETSLFSGLLEFTESKYI